MSNKMLHQSELHPRPQTRLIGFLLLLLLSAGIAWIYLALPPKRVQPSVAPTPQTELISGVVATMDSPPFAYSDGWTVRAQGADPREPLAPWTQPSGVVEFAFVGQELALELAAGDYWGYLYATVDGQPANLLPVIPGNVDSQGNLAGYKTFYAPEQSAQGQPATRWLRIHRNPNSAPNAQHQARVEIWRSWGQTPLRAVAVDALPAWGWPLWPGVVLLLAAAVVWQLSHLASTVDRPLEKLAATANRQVSPLTLLLAMAAVVLIALAVWMDQWWFCLIGLALLGCVSVVRPALWLAALLCGLPFYFGVTLPIMPGRSLGLIDVGVLGGMMVMLANWGMRKWGWGSPPSHFSTPHFSISSPLLRILWLIVGWALVCAVAAAHQDVALREWRTIFLAAGLFALLLTYTLQNSVMQNSAQLDRDRWLLIDAWLLGASVMALIALWQYASGSSLITAEGVYRVRGLYGSPNNLALYLERTLAVCLAIVLLGRGRRRLLWGALGALQLMALLLTFSKGGILLGLPAALLTLAGIGWMLRQQEALPTRRSLGLLLGIALLAILMVAPFLGTERFQRLLDFRQGTGFIRLQLWRSAWQMALEHPLLGVGPDNFLYAYRSDYLLPAAWQEPNLNHPHNLLLDWWTRLGLPGLLLASAFLALGIRCLWRGLQHKADVALYAGLLAAVAASLAHGLIDVSYALPDLMLVWVLIFVLPESCQRRPAPLNLPMTPK